MLTPLILSVAISIDSFSIGVSYGIKKLRIPIFPFVLIISESTASLLLSRAIGDTINMFVSPKISAIISCMMLLGLGLWMFFHSLVTLNSRHKKESNFDKTSTNKNLKLIEIIMAILKEPSQADMDVSGEINTKEALILGIALALDSFGAGLGASIGEFNMMVIIILTTVFNVTFLSLGLTIGHRLSRLWSHNKIELTPGILLIMLGILRLL
ncbi:MAG TPA: sporulation membrane protein YtaF [Clostridiales bacterium]|mgnify:FL=1|nr:sporulation membrane protein YtaF [Clostridiales bacterium]